MEIIVKLISVFYALTAIAALIFIPFIYKDIECKRQLEGISVLKVPLTIINSVVILYASYKAFNFSSECLLWYSVSLLIYTVGATYDQIYRYGKLFHKYIMTTYYYSVTLRAVSIFVLYFLLLQINMNV